MIELSPGAQAVVRLVEEVRAAAGANLHYLALFGALALADICGAATSDNGRSSGPKFKDWVSRHVPEQAGDSDNLWGLRCSLLHQGRAHPDGGSYPIAFTMPGTGQLHKLSTVVGDDRVGWMSIEMFVAELTSGALRWLDDDGDTERVRRNLDKFARFRPEGLPPHIAGPVIA